MDLLSDRNKKIDITKITCCFDSLPEGFRGCRILHISDLHNAQFGKHQEYLVRITKDLKPDYIFITGDLIDEIHKDNQKTYDYLKGVCKIASVFYVTGNHEWITLDKGNALMLFMEKLGIHILHDEIVELERNDSKIQLMGLDDPYKMFTEKRISFERIYSRLFLERFICLNRNKKKMFTILLSHRPEFINFYEKAKIDLVFSGHAHGGQFRIADGKGLLAPHQGFFPKYTEGIIKKNTTRMIVSRGLGNSHFPLRINNRPEIILAVLH